VEYVERDEKEGRILVRPAVGRNLPFGDGFEKLLLAWSFLNVMGYVTFSFSFPIPISDFISKPSVSSNTKTWSKAESEAI
jgi:hypothetical protein